MNKQKKLQIENIRESLNNSKVNPMGLVNEVEQSFLDYAMSVITSRSLADVRDGLKPIHRRILYTAFIEGLSSDKKYKKCATLVGAVMGSFHPHGDSSIYDALVRLAQDFNMRYPLMDGQGNFGSIDGDSAAAYRYTECKLKPLGDLFLNHIKEDTVDFQPNFDGSKEEPSVLPTPVPNLLVNGVQGIAVGMATNIPPHNLTEVCDGVLALLEKPEMTPGELAKYIKGPDFPTGGEVHNEKGIESYIEKGYGKFLNRAKVSIDEANNRLIVTEIPYNLKKNNLIEKIVKLAKPGKYDPQFSEIEGKITNIRDESNQEGIRLIIELKNQVNPKLVLNALFQHSPLQASYSANFTVLVNKVPKVLGVLEILKLFIAFQLDVLLRKSQFNLNKLVERIHILEGRKIIADDILNVVRIITNEDDVEGTLMARYQLSKVQVEDILALPLRAIKKIERQKVIDALEKANFEKDQLTALIASEALQKQAIAANITNVKNKFGDERKTKIIHNSSGRIDIESLIPESDVVITLSEKNYLKRTNISEFKTHKRGGSGVIGARTYEDDQVLKMLVCHSHDDLLFFSSHGKVYRAKAYKISEGDRNTKGRPANQLFTYLEANERINTILVDQTKDHESLMLVTKKGLVKKTKAAEYQSINVNGKKAIVLRDDDELMFANYVDHEDQVVLGSSKNRLVRFNNNLVRDTGRASMGVRGIRLNADEQLISSSTSADGDLVLSISEYGIGKLSLLADFRETARNASGTIAQKHNEKTGKLLMCLVVRGDEDVLLLTNTAKINRFNLASFKTAGRNTVGVKLFNLQPDEKIIYATTYQPLVDDDQLDEFTSEEAVVSDQLESTN